jgi:hypothetical protein
MFRLGLVVVACVSFTGVASSEPVKEKEKPAKKAPAKKASTKKDPTSVPVSKGEKASKKGDKKAVAGKRGKGGPDRLGARRNVQARTVPWKPTRATLANTGGQPLGFSWPPTHAMMEAEKVCEGKLDRAGVKWERAQPEGRIVNPITVASMVFGNVKYTNMWGSKGPFPMDCQLALALETIGPELHALGVREVRFGSLFRWSNVRSGGVTKPFLSRHGLGLAMDIGSFVDADGRVADIFKNYNQQDPLLHAIEGLINANGNFRIVLTPKNDPVSHYNHFHIEAKADYTSPDHK